MLYHQFWNFEAYRSYNRLLFIGPKLLPYTTIIIIITTIIIRMDICVITTQLKAPTHIIVLHMIIPKYIANIITRSPATAMSSTIYVPKSIMQRAPST